MPGNQKNTEMKEQSLPTLGEFIIEKQMDFKYSSGEFSRLISCIQIASKMVNRFINKAGITNVLGEAGNRNVQGEEQIGRAPCRERA